jgi:hypothetical protein
MFREGNDIGIDKQGKYSGLGKISESVSRDPNVVLTADLYNYNTDGNLLKDEHKEWIDTKLCPLLDGYARHVKLIGTASKVGDAQHNKNLSLQRARRVKNYLLSKGFMEAQVPGEEMRAAGSSLSKSKGPNDEKDRAVQIIVGLGRKWRPIFPTIVVPIEIHGGEDPDPIVIHPEPGLVVPEPGLQPSEFSRTWEIKQWGEDSAGFGPKFVGGSLQHWQIRDTRNRVEVFCSAGGVGLGVGTPMSFTGEGPWNKFVTPVPLKITEFAGPYRWNSYYSAGPYSKNYMAFYNLGGMKGYYNVNVETGVTFGASGSTMMTMFMVCGKPQKY